METSADTLLKLHKMFLCDFKYKSAQVLYAFVNIYLPDELTQKLFLHVSLVDVHNFEGSKV